MVEPPWLPFFKKAEAMATTAFEAIPFVGRSIAGFFNTVVVPACAPRRDRILSFLRRRLGGRPASPPAP